MKVEWKVVQDGDMWRVVKNGRRSIRHSTEQGAMDALERSYIATVNAWERNGWTYEVTVAQEHETTIVGHPAPDKLERRNIMFPPSLWAQIEAEASANTTNASALIRQVMTRHLQNGGHNAGQG